MGVRCQGKGWGQEEKRTQLSGGEARDSALVCVGVVEPTKGKKGTGESWLGSAL